MTLLIITSININKFINNQKVLGASIDVSPLQNEKAYWQNIITKNPSYLDGYLELAKVDVELGNKLEAKSYIDKAEALNPNSTKVTSVQLELGL